MFYTARTNWSCFITLTHSVVEDVGMVSVRTFTFRRLHSKQPPLDLV
jgi:hypothetical protein